MIVVKNTVVVLNEVMASMTLAFKRQGLRLLRLMKMMPKYVIYINSI